MEQGSSSANRTPIAFNGNQEFTHFISFPLAIYPKLKQEFEAFRGTAIADMGIEKSLFASPHLFHLTVVMLKLGEEGSVILKAAQKILENQDIRSDVLRALNDRPVYVSLKGLDSMNGDLDKTYVLYAPVEEDDDKRRLLSACHVIIDAFVKAGFAKEDAKSSLKLHVTMMNAIYRKDRSKKSDPFDAQKIHKEFGDKDWGVYLIKEAQLSKRTWFDSLGYYHSCGALPFPQK